MVFDESEVTSHLFNENIVSVEVWK